jgi:hypothetical protein
MTAPTKASMPSRRYQIMMMAAVQPFFFVKTN